MVPTPGTLLPSKTPSPLEKIRSAGPPAPSPPCPAARSRRVPLPARPARGKSKHGPWPPRHPAHPGQTPDAASDGAHPGDAASPGDPVSAGKNPPSGPPAPSPPSPAARSRWVPLPARPARGKSKAGPWPPRHPAHPGQTPDAASDGTHPGDPASPLDPLAAGRKTPPDKHRLQHASQCEIHTEGDTGRPDGAAAEGSGRPGQTEDGESDGAHRGEPAPSDDPVLAGNSPASGPPAPSPAVGRSDGQNLLPTPGWVSGGVGSACGALSARCVEICRSESSADARVGEREGRLGMRGAVGPLRRDLPVTISRHLLRG
ncbi:uncharacterized protein LOC135159714 [Lytechinus pictus]|uniref:uncharacterized protein LOC129284197 n=1 Tax=Lytechinus pictus TaxID=7653 RepID=UPI0030BA0CF1